MPNQRVDVCFFEIANDSVVHIYSEIMFFIIFFKESNQFCDNREKG